MFHNNGSAKTFEPNRRAKSMSVLGVNSGRHLLMLSVSQFDPTRTSTVFYTPIWELEFGISRAGHTVCATCRRYRRSGSRKSVRSRPTSRVHPYEERQAVALFSQHFTEKRNLAPRFRNGTAIQGLTFRFKLL